VPSARREYFVALLPDPSLSGFDKLPDDEQQWRARIYWMVYATSGSAPFSWAVATNRDPAESEEMRAFAAGIPDDAISVALRGIEEGRDPGLHAALATIDDEAGGVPAAQHL
jgi:hypothetical protein